MSGLKQPWLGIASAALIIVLSLLFIAPWDASTFGGWVSVYLMCTIPFSLLVGAFWHGDEPAPVARLAQPARGLAYLAIALVVGAIVAVVLWQTIGGGVNPPLPQLSMAVILSVCTAFWLIIVWGGWPFSLIRNRLAAGIALLVGVYVVTAILFKVFFDFAFLKGAPIYSAALDPQGLFNAWDAVVFAVTAGVAALFFMLALDLWPLTKSPAVMKQPVLGIVLTVVILVIGAIAFLLGTRVAGMTQPGFLVAATVPFIFGAILLLNVLQGSLFAGFAQPIKGILTIVVAAIVGVVLTKVYQALMPVVTGPLAFGPDANFAGELWTANALLAVTFPFLAFFGDFFHLWPLARAGKAVEEEPAEASA